MARIIDFFDGAQSETTPTIGSLVASKIIRYADEAAYVASEGGPENGDIFYSTSEDLFKVYVDGDWQAIVTDADIQDILDRLDQVESDIEDLGEALDVAQQNILDLGESLDALESDLSDVDAKIDNHIADLADPHQTLPSQSGNAGKYLTTDGTNVSWDDVEATGGTGTGTGAKNYFDAEDADFEDGTTGNWAPSGVGLLIIADNDVSKVLAGSRSLRLTKDDQDREDVYIVAELNKVDRADRGKTLFASFQYDATDADYASGDLRVEVWDVTSTPTQLYTGPEPLELLKTQGRFDFPVRLESDTEDIEFRIVVNSDSTDEWQVWFDEFRLGPAVQVQTVYRKSQTIDLTGSGDFTGGSIRVSRVGGVVSINIITQLTYASATSASSAVGAIPPWARPSSGEPANVYDRGSSNILVVRVLENGALTVDTRNYSGTPVNNTITGNRLAISYPVEDNQSQVMSTNELGLQRIKVSAAGNAGQALTANVTDIPFIATSNPFSAWDGTKFIAPKTASYRMQGFVRITTGLDVWFNAFVDGASNKVAAATNENITTHKFMWEGTLLAGQEWSLRPDTNCTLSNEPTAHWLEISSQEDLTVLGAVRNKGYKSAVSSATTSPAANAWPVLTGNFVELEPGDWELTGSGYFVSHSASILFSSPEVIWSDITGTGTTSEPPYVDVAGALININRVGATFNAPGEHVLRQHLLIAPTIQIRVTEPMTVFLNGRLDYGSGTNHTVRTFIQAKRID